MSTVRAIFEDGVFRPTEPVDLPEHTPVEFEPRPVAQAPEDEAMQRVISLLGLRFRSGEADVAARHDEHQP